MSRSGAACNPIAVPERAEPSALLTFLLNLINRILFNRRTNWTPFKHDDEIDLDEIASRNKGT